MLQSLRSTIDHLNMLFKINKLRNGVKQPEGFVLCNNCRRVHITQSTLDYLGGEYEVEAGHGATRNQYLRDNNITTYFIVPPARRRKVN